MSAIANQPAARKLSPRQMETMLYLQLRCDGGLPPTLREIADHLGLASIYAVHELLRRLEVKGWIERLPGVARGIIVLRRLNVEEIACD